EGTGAARDPDCAYVTSGFNFSIIHAIAQSDRPLSILPSELPPPTSECEPGNSTCSTRGSVFQRVGVKSLRRSSTDIAGKPRETLLLNTRAANWNVATRPCF